MAFLQLFNILKISVSLLKSLTSVLEETYIKMNLVIKQSGR